jgi:hypothetical protein
MAMTWLLRARRNPANTRLPVIATLLLAAATVLRVFVGAGALEPGTMLLIASLCWSGAFAMLLVLLLGIDASRVDAHAPD